MYRRYLSVSPGSGSAFRDMRSRRDSDVEETPVVTTSFADSDMVSFGLCSCVRVCVRGRALLLRPVSTNCCGTDKEAIECWKG